MAQKKHTKHSHYMLIVIIVLMAIIISAWSIWFFPNSEPDSGGPTFSNFKHDVLKSFSVFTPEQSKDETKVNIDDLRARVFGDTIERTE